MTYKMLQVLTAGLLIGDNKLPTDEEVLLGLVSYALTTTAALADSRILMTLDSAADVMRLGVGDYFIRRPSLPALLSDVIDIDEELCPAVARYIASYVSKDKGGIHVQAATRIILDYNALSYDIFAQLEAEAEALENDEPLTTDATTAFSL